MTKEQLLQLDAEIYARTVRLWPHNRRRGTLPIQPSKGSQGRRCRVSVLQRVITDNGQQARRSARPSARGIRRIFICERVTNGVLHILRRTAAGVAAASSTMSLRSGRCYICPSIYTVVAVASAAARRLWSGWSMRNTQHERERTWGIWFTV